MQGSVELKKQAVKTISTLLFWAILTSSVAQILHTGYRWYDETDEQLKIIRDNEKRYQHSCMDPNAIVDMNYHDQCRKYDKERNKNPSVAAAMKLVREWGLCDAEKGGCRGVTGLFIGGSIVLIVILYLLRNAPRYVQNTAQCDLEHVSQFMYENRGKVNKFQ